MGSAALTVYFDGTHWKALYELRCDGLLSISEHVFGAELTEPELWEWWLSSGLPTSSPVKASKPVETTKMREAFKAFRPKFRQRRSTHSGEDHATGKTPYCKGRFKKSQRYR